MGATIQTLLKNKRKKAEVKAHLLGKRNDLYDSIREKSKAGQAGSGEQAAKGDGDMEHRSPPKSRKSKRKKGKVSRGGAESGRTTEGSSVQHSLQRSDSGHSAKDSEQSARSDGEQGALL